MKLPYREAPPFRAESFTSWGECPPDFTFPLMMRAGLGGFLCTVFISFYLLFNPLLDFLQFWKFSGNLYHPIDNQSRGHQDAVVGDSLNVLHLDDLNVDT